MKLTIDNYPFYFFSSEIPDDVRRTELENQLTRGNHKSVTANPEIAEKALRNNVWHGFAIPLPAKTVRKIPGAMVQPCGLASQFSLQAEGSRKLKHWLTQNLSY
jgi:hypothetical protein